MAQEITNIIKEVNTEKLKQNQKEQKERKKFIGALPYNKIIIKPIQKELKKENKGIGIKTWSIRKLIRKDKERTSILNKTGVYKIPIKDNNENNPEVTRNNQTKKQFYIGSTKQRLKSRIDEHIKNYQKNQEKTALIQYCNRHNTRPDWENITIVKNHKTEEQIRYAEKIIIHKTKGKNCNIMQENEINRT